MKSHAPLKSSLQSIFAAVLASAILISPQLANADARGDAIAIDDWARKIERRLVDKTKPYSSIVAQRKIRSTEVAFTVARDGTLRDAEILRSSGDARIDAKTLKAVERIAPLPSVPPALDGETVRLSAELVYSLSPKVEVTIGDASLADARY
ncbi:MAG: TonB family protein [Pseudomonadota bacterium]|jgi:TonB family protein